MNQQKGDSKAQQRHQHENASNQSNTTASTVTDKKLDGPNRPAE